MTLVPSTLSDADADRLLRLRRMKVVALGLLVGAAIVYLLTLGLDHSGVWGYVNTMAEAAMVGALADWFAVTALFRHPLGIPIPHTAIIPRKKDDLAGSLQSFFATNFLTEDVVRERLADARIARRVGEWLQDEAHASRLMTEALRVGGALLNRVRDEDVRSLAEEVILPRLQREPMAPILGSLLDAVVDDRAHKGLVDLAFRELHGWLSANPQRFTAMLSERTPRWTPQFLNQRIVTWGYYQALDWVAAVHDNLDHPTRQAIDDFLRRVGRDLQSDPGVQERAEALKVRLLSHPQIGDTVVSLWGTIRHSIAGALDERDSRLQQRGVAAIQRLGEGLATQPAQQERVDRAVADAAAFVTTSYGHELSSVITHTIQRWDGRDASRRIELYVGRDLQFIRINGTVVGALAGLAIHAISQLVV